MSSTAAVSTSPRDIGTAEASGLLLEEYARFLALLDRLGDADWTLPTDCTRWDVRTVTSHVVSWAETMTVPQLLRASLRGRLLAMRQREPGLDGMNALLVRERSGVSGPQLGERLRRVVPRSVAARASLSKPLRAFPVGLSEARVSLGFVNDHIYTRDTWIHRVDISRATGHDMRLTPEHDGRIVADIAADWARRHDGAFELVLDGPAGGTYARGTGGEHHRLDAVEFCRVVSGRAAGQGLLATRVPF